MTPDLEALLQDIGALAMEAIPEGDPKVLIWAQIDDDGDLSADLISGTKDDQARFQLPPPLLEELIRAFWEDWRDTPEAREWRAMAYVIENGGYAIDLTYADELDDDEAPLSLDELRPRAIDKHFGAAIIDYSNP